MAASKKEEQPAKPDPVTKDVGAGSDADTTPVPEVGKTPPNPNNKKSN